MKNDNDTTVLNARGCANKIFTTELPKVIQKVVKISKQNVNNAGKMWEKRQIIQKRRKFTGMLEK